MQKSNVLFHIMISGVNYSSATLFGIPDYSTHLLLGLQVQACLSSVLCILRNLEFLMFCLAPFYLIKEFMISDILEEKVFQTTGARDISW